MTRNDNILSAIAKMGSLLLVACVLCVACSNEAPSANNAPTRVSREAAIRACEECEEQYLNYDAPAYEEEQIATLHDYYMESDEHGTRARALFFCAQASYAKGDTAQALLYLIEAEKSAEANGDYLYDGRIKRMKGDIYGEGYLFANALEEYQKCYESFTKANMASHAQYALFDEGVTLIHIRDFAAAEQILNKTLTYAAEESLLGLYYGTLHYLVDIAIYTGDYDKCGELLELYDEADSEWYNTEHKLFAEAIVAAHNGDMRDADRLLDEIEGTAEVESIEDYYYTHYLVHRIGGDSLRAVEWLERSKEHQDGQILKVLNQPTLNIELELLQSRLDAERTERQLIEKNRQQELRHAEAERGYIVRLNTYIICTIVIGVILLLLYIRYRWRAKNRDIAQYIETIRELQMANRDLPNEMNATIATIYRDRFSEINALCETYYDHSGTTRQKSIVFNQLSQTIEDIKGDDKRLAEMERAVNKYRNNLMQRLREQVSKLSERDMRVALYIFAGFSNRAISIFIDSDPVSVSKLRYNIKQKIKSSSAEDSEELIQALSEK
ncbi:MAG: hypothetical protein IKB15_02320 [Alistipes sp.]|nr:hypothetical protein [Alistipes sp.]